MLDVGGRNPEGKLPQNENTETAARRGSCLMCCAPLRQVDHFPLDSVPTLKCGTNIICEQLSPRKHSKTSPALLFFFFPESGTVKVSVI